MSALCEFFFSLSKTKIREIPKFAKLFGHKQYREDMLAGDVVSRNVVSRVIQLQDVMIREVSSQETKPVRGFVTSAGIFYTFKEHIINSKESITPPM